MKIINILLGKTDNANFKAASDKLKELSDKLELKHPKSIRFKEIYITEIDF